MEYDESFALGKSRSKLGNPTISDFHKIIDYLLHQSESAPFSISDIIAATEVHEADVIEFLDILDKAFALKSCLEHKKTLKFEQDVIKPEQVYDNRAAFDEAIQHTQDSYSDLADSSLDSSPSSILDLLVSAADLPDEEPLENREMLPPPKKVSKPRKQTKKASRLDPPAITKAEEHPQPQIDLSLEEIKNINDFDVICTITKSVDYTKIQQKPHFLDLITRHPELFSQLNSAFQTSALAKEIATQYREFQKINSPLPETLTMKNTTISIRRVK
jgi:hypothetical protein